MRVYKFESGVGLAHFVPEAPDSETELTNIRVVEQHHGTSGQFG